MLRNGAVCFTAVVAALVGWNEYRLSTARANRAPMQLDYSMEPLEEEERTGTPTELVTFFGQSTEPPFVEEAEPLDVMPRPLTEETHQPALLKMITRLIAQPARCPQSSGCTYHGPARGLHPISAKD